MGKIYKLAGTGESFRRITISTAEKIYKSATEDLYLFELGEPFESTRTRPVVYKKVWFRFKTFNEFIDTVIYRFGKKYFSIYRKV